MSDTDLQILTPLLERVLKYVPSERKDYEDALRLFSISRERDGLFPNAIGEQVIRRLLCERLRVEGYVAAHPELTEAVVPAPVFIIGMPRTGTTLLSHLFGVDRAKRCLLHWEALDPIPPPSTSGLYSDPRCIALKRTQEQQMRGSKNAVITHYDAADEPTECGNILAHTLWDLSLSSAPDSLYTAELLRRDMRPVYRYHKKVLQVLQSKTQNAWTLKYPNHAFSIPAIVEVYPDARFIWIHRDPYRASGSFLSHLARQHLASGASIINAVRWLPVLVEYLNRPMQVIQDRPKLQVLHVRYLDLLRSPIASLRRMYAWLGEELQPSVENAMRKWLSDNPQEKLGKHVYSLTKFAVSVDAVAPLFEPYLSNFEVELEGY